MPESVGRRLSLGDGEPDARDHSRAAGRRGELQRYFVERYGEWILLSPPRHGFNLLVWLLPLGAVLAGLAAAALLIRRWTRRARTARTAPATVDAAMSERIRRELERES